MGIILLAISIILINIDIFSLRRRLNILEFKIAKLENKGGF